MRQSARLRGLRVAGALREALAEGYARSKFYGDLLAGITVGIVAIPLSMALAIASGVAPQYGLYTAIIAGVLIALTGGSRYSVSGPTAAFVVILFPVAQTYGLSGILLATLMSGLMLIALATARLGRLIEYIPQPVTLGFTAGIAVVIATLQVKEFLGLDVGSLPDDYIAKITVLAEALPGTNRAALLIGGVTLATLILWPRLRLRVPGHLPAIAVGVGCSLLLSQHGEAVDTIGSRFSYMTADGGMGQGIPAVLPEFAWPWQQPGPDGEPIDWTFSRLAELVPIAFSITMLGAIESLLCAVVLDGMSRTRHHSNGELLGQGIGNLIAPWFGGITATAAIARSATNYRSGAQTPFAAVIHSLLVLASLLFLAPWLAYIPMASMAALLFMVAWNMSEAPKTVALLRKAPLGDALVLGACFSLTVLIDMVVAISVGIVLASLLFMRDMAKMTRIADISGQRKHVPAAIPPDCGVYKINGPLFFAAADRIFGELASLCEGKRLVVLYMDGVPVLDAGGVAALERFLEDQFSRSCEIVIADLQFQPLKTVARAALHPIDHKLRFTATLEEAVSLIPRPV